MLKLFHGIELMLKIFIWKDKNVLEIYFTTT